MLLTRSFVLTILFIPVHAFALDVTLYPTGNTADRTAAINQAVSQIQNSPGGTGSVILTPGNYYHGGILNVPSGITLRGQNSPASNTTYLICSSVPTLSPKTEAICAVKLWGSSPALKWLTIKTTYAGPIERLSAYRCDGSPAALVWVSYASNFYVGGVIIENGCQTGIIVENSFGTSAFPSVIEYCTVRNTLADGIHLTRNSAFINVRNCNINRTGDDYIAVVSYRSDGGLCNNIGIYSNTVGLEVGQVWGRGITVLGGKWISISNNQISNSYFGGMYLACEDGFYKTSAAQDVTVQNNTVTHSNWMRGGERTAAPLN